MSLSSSYAAWLNGRYIRPGSAHRPEVIDDLQAAMGRQLVHRKGEFYTLLHDRDRTTLRGELGRRCRSRRAEGLQGVAAVLTACIDHMAQHAPTGNGYALGRTVTFKLIASSLKMSPRTLERHARDLKALGILRVIQRTGGLVALKFVSSVVLRAVGLLKRFGKAEAAVAKEQASNRAALLDAVTAPFRRRAPTAKRPKPSTARQPPEPPPPNAPPDVTAEMLKIRALLNATKATT